MIEPTLTGLSDAEVAERRKTYGTNSIPEPKQYAVVAVLRDVFGEPIFILLVITAVIYFALGETNEAAIMLIALGFVSGISVFQERRSRNAVAALKRLTAPQTRVTRNGLTFSIPSAEVVVDDIMLLEDGDIIPADGIILFSRDFSVNESILTGESLPLYKSAAQEDNKVFQGTLVSSGACTVRVTKVGIGTALGVIGKSLSSITTAKTPLQLQINDFIKKMVIAGVAAFMVVCVFNFVLTGDWIHSLLHGLTLAMSILPEEIPVAFSTFMALGAYHLYRKNVIAKSPYTVETLGAATVICTDKTGTITENKMEIAAIYDLQSDILHDFTLAPISWNPVLEYAMWASEPEPFDQMERSIHAAYTSAAPEDLRKTFAMIHEYPLDGNPAVMTHVFSGNGEYRIGCKGGLETLLKMTNADKALKERMQSQTELLAGKGYRVLAVGSTAFPDMGLPAQQSGFNFDLLGLIAFYDPPKANMASVMQTFYEAGIDVKMITGDHPATALAIGNQVGLAHNNKVLTGDAVLRMSINDLQKAVQDVHVFARMYPEAKLKVMEALKANGEVVAMTGDGVNDAPALKAAHIGIAMGKRGTETAKNAASLVLVDDDFSKMVDAIALGRRIYENLKKAIRYIISIHVPIILIVTLPLLLMWAFTDIFNPVHVIFLELIMGPTCSIVFENEPIEQGSMQRRPRKMSTAFFSWQELYISIIQGCMITAGCLILGFLAIRTGNSEEHTRTIIFTTLILSNVLLTLVNRSFYLGMLRTLRYRNRLVPVILTISLAILVASMYIPQAASLFRFEPIDPTDWLICAMVAAASVLWIEVYKWRRRVRPK